MQISGVCSDKPTIMMVMLVFRPIKAFVQCLGIRLTIYKDKGGMDASVDICSKQMDFVPSTSLLHLGFVTNLATVQYGRSGPGGLCCHGEPPSRRHQQPAGQRERRHQHCGKLNCLHCSHESVLRVLLHSWVTRLTASAGAVFILSTIRGGGTLPPAGVFAPFPQEHNNNFRSKGANFVLFCTFVKAELFNCLIATTDYTYLFLKQQWFLLCFPNLHLVWHLQSARSSTSISPQELCSATTVKR